MRDDYAGELEPRNGATAERPIMVTVEQDAWNQAIALIKELAQDLAYEIHSRYTEVEPESAEERRMNRDLEPVDRAEQFLYTQMPPAQV